MVGGGTIKIGLTIIHGTTKMEQKMRRSSKLGRENWNNQAKEITMITFTTVCVKICVRLIKTLRFKTTAATYTTSYAMLLPQEYGIFVDGKKMS